VSTGLYSGVSGLALGTGLYKGAQGLWGGSSGLIDQFGATLSLNFLAGAPLDSRITFSRTTNATLVDSTGRVTYAPNNLATYSQEPSNAAWNKTRASITADVMTAPDGTLTGDKLVEDTSATNTHRTSVAAISMTAGASYTWSIFLKAGERTSAVVAMHSSSAGNAFTTNPLFFVDLLTGAITGVSASVTASSAVLVTDGWWRVSVSATATLTTTNTPTVFTAVGGTNAYTGDGVSGLFIWGAQFEAVTYQTLPSTYVQTVASAYYGPRFDYDPVTLAPRGLLIEEQRVNLLLYSAEFDNAGWVKSFAAVTANATTSPDGTTNADRLTADGSLNTHVAQRTVTYTAAAHTLSVYAKRDTNNFVQVRFGVAASAQGFVNFDLNAGTVGTIGATVSSASITPAGNGWYRCTITGTTAAVGSNAGFYIVASATSGSAESNTLTTSVFLYGAQLEAGAFPTSYIPTVASTVTRAADNATITGTNFSSWYNASEGTLVSEAVSTRPAGDTTRLLAASDGTANNSIRLNVATIPLAVVVAGVTEASFTLSTVANAANKYALGYKVNDVNGAVNGVAGTTDTSASIPVVDRLEIGRLGGGASGNVLCGHIRTITFYPQRLANAQLQALTA
jgi:hypothetical protein